MSIPTILGVLISFALVMGAVLSATDNPIIFVSMSSFIIVFGGTLGSAFIAYEARYVLLSMKLIWRIIFSPRIARDILKSEVGRIIRWAYTVQKKGVPALEAEATKAVKGDRFLRFGVEMVVSNYSGEEVREILSNSIETGFERNNVQVTILKSMGASAPAFGMIGTLVGLIIMLDKMGGDPSALGPGLAVALLTTLYGVMFARLVFLPVASKVQQREEIVRFRNYLVAEGLALLAERKGPRHIQDKMNSYLDPAIHFNIDKMRKGGGAPARK